MERIPSRSYLLGSGLNRLVSDSGSRARWEGLAGVGVVLVWGVVSFSHVVSGNPELACCDDGCAARG